MKTIRYAWYIVLALITLVRVIVAIPLMLVYIGADIAGDKSVSARLHKYIDRIIGEWP